MARIRLKYDLADGPYLLTTSDSQTPSNTAPTAIVLNVGTATYPVLSDATGQMLDIRTKFTSSATGGDMRGMYLRTYAYGDPGAGSSVEAMRAFTSVYENITNAHGAHISLGFNASAGGTECSGLGVAVRGTVHIPNVASWAPTGTLSAIQAELYSDGSNSDPAGLTELSFIRVVSGGDATGRDDVDDDAFLMSIQGLTAGAAHVFSTGLTAGTVAGNLTASLKIKVGSTTYYIPLATAIT